MGYKNNKPSKYYNTALEKLFYGLELESSDSLKSTDIGTFFYSKRYPYEADKNASIDKVYPYSNENIVDAYTNDDIADKRILTVGSSGDQMLEFVLSGASSVDVIDANLFAQPFIELKIASIKNLHMIEFMDYFTKDNIFNHKYYWKVCHDLSPKARQFWDNILLEYDSRTRNLFVNKMVQNDFWNKDRKYVNYLKNIDTYNQLAEKLHGCNINFINSAFFDFDKKCRGKYDVIVLSNISDYITSDKYFPIVDSLGKNRLKDGGKMQVYYAFLEIARFTNNFIKSLKKHFGISTEQIIGFNKKLVPALSDRIDINATTILLDKEFFDNYSCQNINESELAD